MKLLLHNLEEHSPGMRNYILCVLTRVLMDYCGGSSVVQKQSGLCAVCRDLPASRKSSESGFSTPGEKRNLVTQQEVDSALSSDASSQDDSIAKHPKWRCLRQFLQFVKNENEALSVQVTQHLLRIVSQGSPIFKQELFYCVLLPLLQAMKEVFPTSCSSPTLTKDTTITLKPNPVECLKKLAAIPLAETVVQYCLSALPLLLYSRAAQDMFLNCGGLKQLTNLVQIQSFRRCVLKVFQVLIVMEDKRDQLWSVDGATDPTTRWSFASHGHLTPDQDDELEVLRNEEIYRTDSTHLLHEQYTERDDNSSSWMNVVDAFMKMVFDSGIFSPFSEDTAHSSQVRVNSESESSGIESEGHDTESRPKPLQEEALNATPELIPNDKSELNILCDIWSTCAVLFPYSRTFQHRFLENDGPKKAYDILMASLRLVCRSDVSGLDAGALSHGKEAGSQFQCWLSLVESTLIICLTSSSMGAVFSNQV